MLQAWPLGHRFDHEAAPRERDRLRRHFKSLEGGGSAVCQVASLRRAASEVSTRSRPMLFIRGDEAEESWRIVDPVMTAWAAGEVTMQEYAAGQEAPGPSS